MTQSAQKQPTTIQHASKQIFSIPQSLQQWSVKPGRLIQWEPSEITRLSCEQAQYCQTPPSYQQHQHLENYTKLKQQNLAMERMLVFAWDRKGIGDLEEIGKQINRHLQSHDTYSHWLTFDSRLNSSSRRLVDTDKIVFEPNDLGHTSSNAIIKTLLSTPGPDQWDCFRFGIIQRDSDYTFFACVDHLHADGHFIAILWKDFNNNPDQRQNTAQAANSAHGTYLRYCQQQRSRLQQLERSDPAIQAWIRFLDQTDGKIPQWPVPLWPEQQLSESRITIATLMHEGECINFQLACKRLNSTFMLGLLGCVAHAIHHLSNLNAIHLVTPVTTRSSPVERRTMGWFTGLVPITVNTAAKSLDEIIQSCTQSFSEHKHLATIPLDHVIKLIHHSKPVTRPGYGGYMFSYSWPIHRALLEELIHNNCQFFLNQGAAQNINIWATRSYQGLSISASHPNSDKALQSINTFSQLMRESCLSLARIRH